MSDPEPTRTNTVIAIVAALTLTALPLSCCGIGLLMLSDSSSQLGPASIEEAEARWNQYLRDVPRPHTEHRLTVTIAADEEFRARLDWENEARRIVVSADETFAREFRTAIELVAITSCTTDNDLRDVLEIWDHALPLVDGATDIVVLLTDQAPRPGLDAETCTRRGCSEFFSQLVVLRPHRPDDPLLYEREVLSHEIGHLFGAWHRDESTSVMRTYCSDREARTFDKVSRETIETGIAKRVHLGVHTLPPEPVSTSLRRFRDDPLVGPTGIPPVCHALIRSVRRRALDGEAPHAIAFELRRAMKMLSCDESALDSRTRREIREIRKCIERSTQNEAK